MTNIIIHLGLHKTASTFLQKRFFILLNNNDFTYVNLRTQNPEFLDYILYKNDLQFEPETGLKLFLNNLEKVIINPKGTILISDEQFCGSPWDNASMRKTYFDRLNKLFPSASYILITRKHENLVESLYLQYIKTGGSVSWKTFLLYEKFPLSFSLKAYLDYDLYIDYIISKIGHNRLKCFEYEEFQKEPVMFLEKLGNHLVPNFFVDENRLNSLSTIKENKSITPFFARFLIFFNKFIKSEKQPFLFLPRKFHNFLLKTLIFFSCKNKKKRIIPIKEVEEFCSEFKRNF